MKNATITLAAMLAVTWLLPADTLGALPDGKVAVVRVTAVDGLAHHPIKDMDRSSVFSFDGTEYNIDRSALSSLDGVQTLMLIDRKTDELSGSSMVRHLSQEVRAFGGTSFEVKDLKGKVLSYQVAMLGGNLRLLGDGDQILALPGADGPFQVWKITGIALVDKKSIVLQEIW